MPFKWREIFSKENTIVKARADKAINDSTDPHLLLQISIRELQEEHDNLEHACSVVIGQFNMAKEKLEGDLEAERQLDTQGKAAAKAGHLDAARAIAHRLDAVRARLATEQRMFDAGKARADEAKAAFAENGELLRQKMDEAKSLDAEIDQAAMEHNMNEAMKSVTSMTSHATPSFDQIRDRVQAQHAEEAAEAELEGTDPDMSAIHEQHLVHEAAADDILAQWTTGAPASDAPRPAGA
ncbi:MAG: PspA/IM30 family protein, partial [Acidimicrobiales bacterium]